MKYIVLFMLLFSMCCNGTSSAPLISLIRQSKTKSTSFLANGDFEKVVNNQFVDWEPFDEGYSIAQGMGRNGSTALYIDSPDISKSRGACRIVRLNQTSAIPIRVTCWSRCEGVDGSPSGEYSIYADLEYTDGTPLWGQIRAFPTGNTDWTLNEYIINPVKPVKQIKIHCLFRNRKGKAWFDDVNIEQLKPATGLIALQGQVVKVNKIQVSKSATMNLASKDGFKIGLSGTSIASVSYKNRPISCDSPSGFLVKDFQKNSDYYGFSKVKTNGNNISAECPELGLALKAQFQSENDHIRVTGRITDTTGKDRAVNMMFALPVDASGWTWWDDIRIKRKIRPMAPTGPEYSNTNDVSCGLTSTASVYPVAAITSPQDGLSIGLDWGKTAIYRVFYNLGTRQLAIAYDFALVPDTQNFPSSADFSFVIYRFNPEWGFRQSWQKYASIFPEYFKVRTREHGIWMPFGDISTVEGWKDFGFKFHEGPSNYQFDYENNIQAFRYSEPTTWWMSVPGTDRTQKAVIEQCDKFAEQDKGASGMMANAVKNSAMMDAQGNLCYQVLDTPWCKGVVWNMSPNPYNQQKPNGGTVLWNEEIKKSDYGPQVKQPRDGEYLDSLEGYVTSDTNYRREHFKYTTVPLVFDAQSRPLIFKGLAIWEFTKYISDDIHSINKLMFANSVPHKFTYLGSLLDIMGTETSWLGEDRIRYESDAVMNQRRTICYGKPYLLLMNTNFDLFNSEMVEKYFRRCGFYAILPSMFSSDAANDAYFSTPRWYNRDRELFKRYIPVIKQLSEAGWEPITLATSSNPHVYLERYGRRYITVLNNSDNKQSVDIKINMNALGLGKSLTATELYSGRKISISNSLCSTQLDAQDVMVIDLAQ